MAIITGTAGNDLFIAGTQENDRIFGLTGDDYIFGDTGDDQLFGGDGNDALSGGDGNDYLDGGKGNDSLGGDSGNDKMYGFAGEDTFYGGEGNDELFGGEGNDDLDGADDDDKLYGEQGNDRVYGYTGNDTLYGGAGNDQLLGWLGNDTLYGGDGNDLLDGEPATYGYADGANHIDSLFGNAGRDTFKISYIDDDDPLTPGTSGYSLIKDFAPNQDFVELTGDKSNYFLAASPKGLPQGTAIYLDQPGTGTDELIAIVENKSNLSLTASYFTTTVDDIYYGTQFADRFNTGAGNDSLYGNRGDDTLNGGDGNDSVNGDYGNDTVLGGNGNDTLSGVVELEGGSELIRGQGEIDTLTGGAGADLFLLGAVEGYKYGTTSYLYYDDGNDRSSGTNDYALITDFNSSQDSLRLLGSANNYILMSTGGSLPAGTGIYFDRPSGEPDELISILQGVSPSSLNLTASYFNYVV